MIGVFDSGFGGLTILRDLVKKLPNYDFAYLGDNSRAPYGNRSFETIHRYALEAVQYLFGFGCPLVILACNTASAKALRTIQQKDLAGDFLNAGAMGVAKVGGNRVLGIIRPMSEEIGKFTKTGHIGILGTEGTISSESYLLEIAKFFPQLKVSQIACPILVPLVENGLQKHYAAEIFVREYTTEILKKDPEIDTLLLACTHYPLLKETFEKVLPTNVKVVAQGEVVAEKTADYLNRHSEIDNRISKNIGDRGKIRFLTTDSAEFFERGAKNFWEGDVKAESVLL